MSSQEHVLIIGAGQAGGAACIALRQFGHEGPITLIGEEAAPPYQRPPLSKAYFKGEMAQERLFIKPLNYYEDNQISLKLGLQATSVDRTSKSVSLDNGEKASYDKLIFATGSRPRLLPVEGAELSGVQVLRTLADVDALRPLAQPGKKLIVVGAGYIGLEAAAVAQSLGLEVTVLEAMDRVLARVTSPIISEFYQNQHRARGVDVRLNARMKGFIGEGGKLTGVKMENGEVLSADIVLVGIGIIPNQELAAAAGIDCQDGIVTNEDAQTSDPDLFAIGDCARRPIPAYAREGRLESVHNALEQAKLAAAAICGKPRPKLDAPWFWSDQYELKLQTAGLLTGYDQAVIRGDVEANKFAVWYLREGVFLAVDAVNSPPDFLMGKKLVGANAKPNAEKLADPQMNLKDLVAEALQATS